MDDKLEQFEVDRQTLEVGESLRISFMEHASTGYVWTVDTNCPFKITRIDNDCDNIGGSQEITFALQPKKTGVYQATFTHKRPWGEEIEEMCFYEITVTPEV